jgi:predicted DNA-binding transcriptional regulator AlpA
MTFPDTGFVRLKAILGPVGPIPLSRSTWWAGVRSGRFPAPIKIGGATAWPVASIKALINELNGGASEPSSSPRDRIPFKAGGQS